MKIPPLQGEVYDFCVRSILLDGFDALLHCSCAGIHLAGADNLAVGSLEVEIRLAVLGDITLETLLQRAVFLYGFNAFKAGFL